MVVATLWPKKTTASGSRPAHIWRKCSTAAFAAASDASSTATRSGSTSTSSPVACPPAGSGPASTASSCSRPPEASPARPVERNPVRVTGPRPGQQAILPDRAADTRASLILIGSQHAVGSISRSRGERHLRYRITCIRPRRGGGRPDREAGVLRGLRHHPGPGRSPPGTEAEGLVENVQPTGRKDPRARVGVSQNSQNTRVDRIPIASRTHATLLSLHTAGFGLHSAWS